MLPPCGGFRNPEILALPAAALAIAAGLAGGALVRGDRRSAEPFVTFRPIHAPGGSYVSSDACRACHPSQYASWHASFHRTMTQVAMPNTVATSFDGITVDAVAGEPIRLEQRGRALLAELVDPDGGLTPSRIARRLVMT